MPCRIRVALEDGREIVTECLYQPGHSAPTGLDAEVVQAKFLTFSQPAVSAERCEVIIACVLGMSGTEPIGDLTRLVGGG